MYFVVHTNRVLLGNNLDNNIRGSQMKNTNLLNTTIMVIAVAFASSFVNADDKITQTIEKTQIEVIEHLEFSTLIEKLDSDKNGMLSEAEAHSDKSQLLHSQFKKMDSNQDKQIDEAEYNRYLTAVKDDASATVKSLI